MRGEEESRLPFTNNKLDKQVADQVGLSKIQFFFWKSVWFWKLLLIYRSYMRYQSGCWTDPGFEFCLNFPLLLPHRPPWFNMWLWDLFFFSPNYKVRRRTQGISGGASSFNLPSQRAEDFINVYFLTPLHYSFLFPFYLINPFNPSSKGFLSQNFDRNLNSALVFSSCAEWNWTLISSPHIFWPKEESKLCPRMEFASSRSWEMELVSWSELSCAQRALPAKFSNEFCHTWKGSVASCAQLPSHAAPASAGPLGSSCLHPFERRDLRTSFLPGFWSSSCLVILFLLEEFRRWSL